MIRYAFEFTGPIKVKEAHIHINIQPSISTKSCSESFPTSMICQVVKGTDRPSCQDIGQLILAGQDMLS